MKSQASTNKVYLFLEQHRWLMPFIVLCIIILCIGIFTYKIRTSSQRTATNRHVLISSAEEEQQLHQRLQNYQEQQRFDFYHMLEKKPNTPQSIAKQKQIRYHYLLQAGSYADLEAADRLKALLALNGFEPKLRTVELEAQKWHRIVLGPFPTQQQASNLQARLQKLAIEGSLVLKQPITGE